MGDVWTKAAEQLGANYAQTRGASTLVGGIACALITPTEALAICSAFAAGVVSALATGRHITCVVPSSYVDTDGTFSPGLVDVISDPITTTGGGIAAGALLRGVPAVSYVAGVPDDTSWRRQSLPGLASGDYEPCITSADQASGLAEIRELIDCYQAVLDEVSSAVFAASPDMFTGLDNANTPMSDTASQAFWSALSNLAANLDAIGEELPASMAPDVIGGVKAATKAAADAVAGAAKSVATDAAQAANWTAKNAADIVSTFVANLSLPLLVAAAVGFLAWRQGWI